jgi:hypothetical protein
MTRFHDRFWSSVFLVCFAWLPVRAQNLQFYRELDVNLKLSSVVRVNLDAGKDAGNPLQSEIGPSIQFYLKPLIRLRDVTAFDLNDAKSRFLVMETGFRYITALNAPPENRMLVATIFNFPLRAGFLISDRNRSDLDWKSGKFTWRYRNRFELERTVAVLSYHLIPYLASEPYYESQYNKWSTTALYAGCLFPIDKHVQFDSYYEHENNTGKRPNRQDQGSDWLSTSIFLQRNNESHVSSAGGLGVNERSERVLFISALHAAALAIVIGYPAMAGRLCQTLDEVHNTSRISTETNPMESPDVDRPSL